MRRMIDAIRAWLPTGRYRFRGGPADGREIAVKLDERSYGLVPPEYWRVAERPVPPGMSAKTAAMDMAYRVHTYRFVPLAGSINEGHYEHVA